MNSVNKNYIVRAIIPQIDFSYPIFEQEFSRMQQTKRVHKNSTKLGARASSYLKLR